MWRARKQSEGKLAGRDRLPAAIIICCDGICNFFHPITGQALITRARRVVKVWDPYVHKEDEILFRNIRSGISLRVLTLGGVTGPVPEPLNLVQFKRDIIKYSPSVDLEVRFLDKSSTKDCEWFHDRYLFIDDDAYFVGRSMHGHTNRLSSTALTIIQDVSAVALLRNRFNTVWNNHKTIKVKG